MSNMASLHHLWLTIALAIFKVNCLVPIDVGGGCRVKHGNPGVCTEFLACDSAQQMIAKRARPDLCRDFVRGEPPIVCCETPKRAPGNVTARMCVKYGEAVTQRVQVPSMLLDEEPQWDHVSTCAMAATELIVGGEVARPMEYPHMAVLGYGQPEAKAWLCGGSLISERYILSAAHCARSHRGVVRWALLGDLNYKSTEDESNPQLMDVVHVITHPAYRKSQFYNDIALLKLGGDVVFDGYARPACLNVNPTIPIGQAVTATGWGLTNSSSTTTSTELMYVGLTVVDKSVCTKSFQAVMGALGKLSRGFDHATLVCATDTGPSVNGKFKDTCGGDSGAPLQITLDDPHCMYSIVGVLSFGHAACGDARQPAGYTRVSAFIPWIENIVWPN